jgi:hypothetical protein
MGYFPCWNNKCLIVFSCLKEVKSYMVDNKINSTDHSLNLYLSIFFVQFCRNCLNKTEMFAIILLVALNILNISFHGMALFLGILF